jgi:hypothetical protein
MSSRSLVIAAAAAAVLLTSAVAGARAAEPRYSSLEEAVKQGVNAYRGGFYELAIDPLEYGAARNDFLARYYLARIYSDNGSVHTDHARAYRLYQRLADEFGDIDPDDDRRKIFIAKSLTALAGYLRMGLSEIGLKPDPVRAQEYLHHAATFFDDEDAQFQLARQIFERGLQRGKSGRDPAGEKLATHWLAVLTTEKRHAGAQALLAYLMWRGEHQPLIAKDPQRAVALVTVAAENAPVADRIWIDDYYQEIYCAVVAGGRKSPDGMVASYRRQYGQHDNARLAGRERSALGALQPEAQRACGNGEPLPPVRRASARQGQDAPPPSALPLARPAGTPSPTLGIMGTSSPAPVR